jgi:hypothetical protein
VNRKIAKSKIGEAPTPKPVSPEPPADGEERLDDIDHMDELNRMKHRIFGLEAAILGACNSDTSFNHGLKRLASDIADAMAACAEAFEAERELRRSE